MQSTPAVFCGTDIAFGSVSCNSTPAGLDNGAYPWAVSTPENSPRCCYAMPPAFDVPHLRMEPVIPRELVQAACEPFFHQMVTVLQESLHTQMHPGQKLSEITETMMHVATASFHSNPHPFPYGATQSNLLLDEVSTEADETGAFASIFSGPSSEGESVDGIDAICPAAERIPPLTPGRDSDLSSDLDKSSMVCRHWKTKGWCRMESNCKFLHPENKRGIAAPNAGNRSSTNGGGISGTVSCMSTAYGQCDSMGGECDLLSTRRKKRGGRNRTNRNKQAQMDGGDQELGFIQMHVCTSRAPFV